jgi:hypothetical protein
VEKEVVDVGKVFLIVEVVLCCGILKNDGSRARALLTNMKHDHPSQYPLPNMITRGKVLNPYYLIS